MFPRDNEGKDKLNESVTSSKEQKSDRTENKAMSREELFSQDEEAKKIYEDIMSLRKSVEALKTDDMDILPDSGSSRQESKDIVLEDTEEIIAAKQAIIEQARRDAEAERIQREEALKRELKKKQAQQEILEAQKRAALIEEEAEKKRRRAAEAERRAKAISRKQALDAMEAEIQAKNKQLRENNTASESEATPEEIREFFDEDKPEDLMKGLEEAKKELLSAQQQQDAKIGTISQMTEKHTEKLAAEQQIKLTQQQELLKEEQAKLQDLLEAHKSERLAREEREKNERALREQRTKVEKLIKEEKAKAAREEKLAKAKKKRDEKIQRIEAKERHKREKREAAERAKLEKERLKQKSIADAELGGGVVNVKGMQINTKIKDTMSISLKDLLGVADRKERKESSEAKTQQMREEREKRREEAREAVELSMKQKMLDYENSPLGKRMKGLKTFCDNHKAPLLTLFSVFIMLLVGVAGVFNYCTAYEYSYNGKTLGLVKEKDEVLRITDLVQGALTEDKNVDVIIDAKDDIEFKRVSALGDVEIDNSEEVLKRLSYMGNLNVKAYGIYVNGKKVGAVESKEAAADVMQDIKDRYTSGREGAEIEEAVFIEKVDVKQSNTDLEDVLSEKEMVEKLCTSGETEKMHKVVAGETLADIAKLYSMTEEDILQENPNVDQKKLEVGSVLKIKQHAPLLTVKITELVTYEKQIEYEVEEKDDADLYEGYTETHQKGENGLSEITSRIVLVNGEEKEETPLVTTVKKEPVTGVIMVGTKEKPPTVGSGKYIWPLSGGYTLTSNFGSRWGRSHEGIDLGCPVGSNVLAADGGTVTYAGYSGAYGYLVIIDHQNGMETRYAHNSSLLVSKGDKVYQGQHIAESGNTGRSTGPHCHFEIRVNGVAKNPINYLP